MKQFFTSKHSLFLVLFLCLAKLSAAQLPYMVKYLNVKDALNPSTLTNVNGILFFTAYDTDFTYGNELWRSDGTSAGTYMVKDINVGAGGSEIYRIVNVNGKAFFKASGTGGDRLWKSDGTPEGTEIVSTAVRPTGNMINVNGTFFFNGNDTANGTELWKSDGTANGTTLVKDVNPGAFSSFIYYMTNVGGTLYFRATYNSNMELWKSDGTPDGTVMVKQFPNSADLTNFTDVNGTLFFMAYDATNGKELWMSDGTALGTKLVKDIYPGSTGSGINEIVNVDGTAYFMAEHPDYGNELWKSDGTPEGTERVKDIVSGSLGSYPHSLINVNGTLFFIADDMISGRELWKSDGTEEGTVLVKDIAEGPWEPYVENLTDVNGTLYFTADNGATGKELWKTDGTEAGTVLVKDINPDLDDSNANLLTNVNGKLYFLASASVDGVDYSSELWSLGTCTTANAIVTTSGKTVVYNTQKQNSPATSTCHCDVFNNLIAVVDSTGESAVGGNISTKVWIEPYSEDYVRRHYEIYPLEDIPDIATGNVTLYFTQADFDSYNNAASEGTPKLPVNSTDTEGISHIMIEKRVGTSEDETGSPGSYYGTRSTINLEDIDVSWNSTAQRWEISFSTTGFGGFFLKSPVPNPPEDVAVSATFVCSGESVTLWSSCTSGTLNWYTSASGGTSIGTSDEMVVYPTSTTTYYAACEYGEFSSARVSTNEVEVFAAPAIPTEVKVDNANICSGQSVTLSASCATGTILWYNASSGGDLIGTGNSVTPSPTVNTTYYAACDNDNCSSARVATEEVVITQQVTKPTGVLVDKTAICSGTTITLTGNCTVGTLTWYDTQDGGESIGTGNSLSQTPEYSYTYYAACENGICISERVPTSYVYLTIQPTDPTDVSISETAICSGTAVDLTATCPIGTVKWYTQLSGGSAISSESTLQLSPTETTSYYAACENGECKTERVLAGEVTVTAQPTNPTGVSVSSTKICTNEFISLHATCNVGTITWYRGENETISAGVDDNWGEALNSSTSYYVACENGDCKSERVLVGTVIVTEQPVLPTDVTVSETAICSGTSITLSAFCSVGDVAWYRIAEDEDIFLETGSVINQTPTTTTKYYAMCINGICESSRIITQEVVVTGTPSKPTGVMVDKTSICSGTSISLTATCDLGIITWYNDSIADTSIGTGSGLTITPTDTYTYYAVCINGDCKSEMANTDMVTVTTQPTNPVNVATYTSAVCSGEPANLSADCAVGEVVWYSAATASTASGTGQYFDPAITSNTTYYVACENGTCKSERVATEEITVRPKPDKPMDLSQWDTKVCGEMSVGLSGSCATGTLKWYDSATATTPAYEGAAVYAPIIKTVTYYAACETTFCSSERVAMKEIVFYTRPLDPTGITVNKTAICSGDSVTLSATCSIGEVKWIRVYKAGGVDQYDLVPTHAPTENSIYYAYCMNGPCISSYLPADTITVTEQPGIPTDLFQAGTQICAGTSMYVNASCAKGTITWYNSATGGTALGTGEFFIVQPATTATYYVSCENGICKSARVALNEIVVYQQPVAPTGVSVSKTAICNGETISLLGSCSIGTLRWYKTSMDPDTAFTYKPKVNTVYRASCSNGFCSSESVATAEVVVTQQPVNPTSVSVDKTIICKEESITLTANCSIGTVTWYNSSTGTTVIGTGNSFSQSPAATITYYAACLNGICKSERVATDTIIVKPKPTVPVIAGRGAICNGENVTLSASASANDASATFHWSGGRTGASINVVPTVTSNYKVLTKFDGCSSDSSTVFTITVNRVPEQPGITADNVTICRGSNVVLNAQCMSATDSFYWSTSAVTNGDTPAGYYKSTRVITEPGTYKGWCQSNTGCKGPEKSITITTGTNCGGKNFITITPAKPVLCPGSSVTLTAAGCSGSISWLGGVSTQTGTSITITPAANVTYLAQCSAGGFASVDVTVTTSAVAVSSNISTGTELVKAVNTIESDKKIGDPDFTPAPVVTFEAGKSILLKPGFVADSRSVFKAEIKGCN
jgi:ELWxxDGT repeat protein